MNVRLMIVLVGSLALAGCATTRPAATSLNQVQNQVVDLEQRMEEQEKEIVDLKYEVKDLAGKVEVARSVPEDKAPKPAVVNMEAVTASTGAGDADSILKVLVAPVDVQKALKAAGMYDGKLDGKLGPKTKAAIKEFQKQHQLKADGVIGQKTWAEMKTYLAE